MITLEDRKVDNLYFPIYINLEREIIDLASSIHFNDEQSEVYSLKIADLIIRSSIELESIAKNIFIKKTKSKPKNPGKCFKWLETNWKLSNKSISIISPYLYFKNKYMPNFCPFNYVSGSAEDYYSSYNSIKHDRAKNLEKATINILIRVLGALFILITYHTNKIISLGDDYLGEKIDVSGWSEIFKFYVAPCEKGKFFYCNKDINPDSCIYKIKKVEDSYAIQISYKNKKNEIRYDNLVLIDQPFQDFAKNNLGKRYEVDELFNLLSPIIDINLEQSKENMIKYYDIEKFLNAIPVKMKDTFKAELNIDS